MFSSLVQVNVLAKSEQSPTNVIPGPAAPSSPWTATPTLTVIVFDVNSLPSEFV